MFPLQPEVMSVITMILPWVYFHLLPTHPCAQYSSHQNGLKSGNYHSASSWPSSPAMAGPPFPFVRPSTRALSHGSLFHVSLGKVISSNYEFYRLKSNETHECQTLRFPSAANPAHWHWSHDSAVLPHPEKRGSWRDELGSLTTQA